MLIIFMGTFDVNALYVISLKFLTVKFMSAIIVIAHALLSIKTAFVNYVYCYLVLYANNTFKHSFLIFILNVLIT